MNFLLASVTASTGVLLSELTRSLRESKAVRLPPSFPLSLPDGSAAPPPMPSVALPLCSLVPAGGYTLTVPKTLIPSRYLDAID